MQDYKKLDVWQVAHAFARDVYVATRSFPKEERFGLTSQLRRASVSVPTNIVEGSRRTSPVEFARFLNIAEGSAAECEYLLMLSAELIEIQSFGTMRTTDSFVDGLDLRPLVDSIEMSRHIAPCTPEESRELTQSIIETEVATLQQLVGTADRIKAMLYGLRTKLER